MKYNNQLHCALRRKVRRANSGIARFSQALPCSTVSRMHDERSDATRTSLSRAGRVSPKAAPALPATVSANAFLPTR